MLCKAFIKALEGTDDPRKDDAIQHYQSQLAELEQKLKREREGIPEDIVIGLKSAQIFGKSEI